MVKCQMQWCVSVHLHTSNEHIYGRDVCMKYTWKSIIIGDLVSECERDDPFVSNRMDCDSLKCCSTTSKHTWTGQLLEIKSKMREKQKSRNIQAHTQKKQPRCSRHSNSINGWKTLFFGLVFQKSKIKRAMKWKRAATSIIQ